MIDHTMRFENNPFDREFEIKVKGQQVTLASGITKPSLCSGVTGELAMEQTHVVTYKEVDAEEFLKLFTRNISLLFNLSAAGHKALIVLCFAVQRYALNKDTIRLGREVLREFLNEHGAWLNVEFTEPTFNRGLKDLVIKNVIAKTKNPGQYFINHRLVFNGNRFTLTNIIQKVDKSRVERSERRKENYKKKKEEKIYIFKK